ncbi:MAG: Glu-tRNA(Gln) amidotransferase subunit GatD [Candidatus Thorarchaeota archaeon]
MVYEKLDSIAAKIGNTILIEQGEKKYVGILMPRSQVGSDPNHIVIKLENGYNLGIRVAQDTVIKKGKSPRSIRPEVSLVEAGSDPNLPSVSVLSTGGTIASRVDYRTGAVNPALSAQDLYDAVPELKEYANVHAKILMSILSENITPADWSQIAKRIATEIRSDVDGLVIAHGTDTMGYTAAALSFALHNLPIPIVLVGSQRSSDRPSSDAASNLIGATRLAGRADVAEVMVAMHGETDDSFLYAHRGTRVRKLHSSRRDAFQSINSYPLFRILDDRIEEISEPLLRRDSTRSLQVKPKFESKVALVKTYPGMDGLLIDSFVDNGYRGVVIEGTGLGHTPDSLQPSLKRAIDAGMVVAMTTQCINGRVDMNVYRSGVQLLDIGVVSCENTISETALVKLMWLLANTKTTEDAKALMAVSLAGELDMRSEVAEYDTGMGV